MSSEKISLYNLADLKNTTDDAIPNYLNSLKFKQAHHLTDVRLALGYGSFVIAAACFAWDYQFGFEATKLWTTAAVAIYGVLSWALTFWMSNVEAGTIYQGTLPSGEKLNIASSTKKHDPTYNLVVLTYKSSSSDPEILEVSGKFNRWFDETGALAVAPLQEFLASSIPLVGSKDPKRVKTESQSMLDANPELLDALLASEATTTAAEPAEKKGGKRRKA